MAIETSTPSPPIDDPALLGRLPNALRALVEHLAGVHFDGALHIRGACSRPAWHSLAAAWEHAGARADHIPFARTTFGDELALRGHDVVRRLGETGREDAIGTSIGGFIAELERDARRFLDLDPALRPTQAEWEPLLAFWFEDAGERPERIAELNQRWFMGGEAFDDALRERFAPLLDRAEAGGLDDWRRTPRGTLAFVLVHDQLTRNLRRNDPRAFALDARAREAAGAAIDRGFDHLLRAVEASFLYLPYEHSESLADQQHCVALYESLCARAPRGAETSLEGALDFAQRHLVLIERFGRFPHRNAVLGRPPTAEEEAFLTDGGETF